MQAIHERGFEMRAGHRTHRCDVQGSGLAGEARVAGRAHQNHIGDRAASHNTTAKSWPGLASTSKEALAAGRARAVHAPLRDRRAGGHEVVRRGLCQTWRTLGSRCQQPADHMGVS